MITCLCTHIIYEWALMKVTITLQHLTAYVLIVYVCVIMYVNFLGTN